MLEKTSGEVGGLKIYHRIRLFRYISEHDAQELCHNIYML
jgi:hypothetical protein